MVLLDNVIEVFALSDHDLGAMLPIAVLDSGVVRTAFVDVDDLGKGWSTISFAWPTPISCPDLRRRRAKPDDGHVAK
jgi:hypothetical protein